MTKAPRSISSRATSNGAARRHASRQNSEPALGAGADPGSNVAEFSVTDLAMAIKGTIERGFGHVRLRGEVSGYRGPHSSGHCYFTIKDEKARIDAVIWRGVFGRLRFKPEEGMEVIATGKVTTYPGSSKYQIVIEALEPAGAGALMALLEERKKKFAAEGLFAEERKRALPFLPRVVGVITSPTGAVIRDMLHGFDERFPAHVILWPVRVQGETSAEEVAAAVRGFNGFGGRGGDGGGAKSDAAGGGTVAAGDFPRPDVLIVARGGGSLEDLWGFNEEVVVRAVAESDIPVIAAVGHETDWTLIDLVADARAPTPTKAAEWAVPKYSDLLEGNAKLSERLHIAMRRQIEHGQNLLRAAARGLPRLQDLLALPRQRFDTAQQRLSRALSANTRQHALRLMQVGSPLRPQMLLQRVAQGVERLAALEARGGRAFVNRVVNARRQLDASGKLLGSLSYQSVLQRGFTVVRDEAGKMLRDVAAAAEAGRLEIEFADGHLTAQASGGGTGMGEAEGRAKGDTVRQGGAVSAGAAKAKPKAPRGLRLPKTRKPTSGGQGSLF